ncbi:MAG: hypothetical protein U5K69_11680 [Balneolaceae bacterium]|nr:hypothetical protein [Balneolaceae bacterium]
MKSFVSADEAVQTISSGDRVFIHSVAAAPHHLLNAMVDRADQLKDVELISLHTEGSAPYTDPKYKESFRMNALFVGANVRDAVNSGRGDYLPIFLSETPYLFRDNILPLDVALVQVSPPDKHGFCSLGVSVDASRAAVQTAKKVVAQVNPRMPRTHGDGMVHVSRFDKMVEHETPLPEHKVAEPGKTEQKIGNICAELIEDGATLQMGIGGIPNAVLNALDNHKDLGIHTEMFSDGIIDLLESGVINNKKEKTASRENRFHLFDGITKTL